MFHCTGIHVHTQLRTAHGLKHRINTLLFSAPLSFFYKQRFGVQKVGPETQSTAKRSDVFTIDDTIEAAEVSSHLSNIYMYCNNSILCM